jgi:hypothetical protein
MSSPADFRFSTNDGWMQSSLLDLLSELEEYFEERGDPEPETKYHKEYGYFCDIRDCINAIEGTRK